MIAIAVIILVSGFVTLRPLVNFDAYDTGPLDLLLVLAGVAQIVCGILLLTVL